MNAEFGSHIKGLLLDKNISVHRQPERLQSALAAMLDLINVFYILNRTGPTELSVPSARIFELGLVPNAPATDNITLSINKVPTGYLLMGHYVDQKTKYKMNDHNFYLDTRVEEITHLTVRPDGVPTVTMQERIINRDLTAFNATWSKGITEEPRKVKLSPKRINITLATLAIAVNF